MCLQDRGEGFLQRAGCSPRRQADPGSRFGNVSPAPSLPEALGTARRGDPCGFRGVAAGAAPSQIPLGSGVGSCTIPNIPGERGWELHHPKYPRGEGLGAAPSQISLGRGACLLALGPPKALLVEVPLLIHVWGG